VVRGLNNAGSLRDLLCTAKPKLQFMKKYGNPKQYRPLSPSDMACFGRQILEVLRFLSEKGLPFGMAHTYWLLVVCMLVRTFKRLCHLCANRATVCLVKLVCHFGFTVFT
jgi:hypothetical protein